LAKHKIIATPNFEREYKRLAKKYASLGKDVGKVVTQLTESPALGTSLGRNVYKIRFAIASKNKGKSGGGRIITYFVSEDRAVHLLSIYDKSEFDTITDSDIMELLGSIR
jgi:mRNA-degrading endonuclease RelE of RelBE toxin-antitoxin system